MLLWWPASVRPFVCPCHWRRQLWDTGARASPRFPTIFLNSLQSRTKSITLSGSPFPVALKTSEIGKATRGVIPPLKTTQICIVFGRGSALHPAGELKRYSWPLSRPRRGYPSSFFTQSTPLTSQSRHLSLWSPRTESWRRYWSVYAKSVKPIFVKSCGIVGYSILVLVVLLSN